MNIFEIEKTILKAQTPQEIDDITNNLNRNELRNIVKLLIDILTPERVKINRILNSNWSDQLNKEEEE